VRASSGSGKGKEQVTVSGPTTKVGSQSATRGGGVPLASTAPLEKKRRLFHSDRSTVGGPLLSG
jgi:hypothetical protein